MDRTRWTGTPSWARGRRLRVGGWLVIVLLALMYGAVLFNWLNPRVRLTIPALNYIAFGVAQGIPLLVSVAVLVACRRWWSRLIGGALCAPVVTVALILGAFACSMGLGHGEDPSFVRLRAVPTRYGMLAVYRTDGGATTSVGVLVRLECPLMTGVVRVRDLGYGYPADDVQLELLDGAAVRATFPTYRHDRPARQPWTRTLSEGCGSGPDPTP
jgi:hypothetical protein